MSFDPPISKAYEYFVFLGRVTNPPAKPPFLEDQFVSLSLASLLRPVRLGRPYQEHKFPSGIARNTPSTTNLEEEEIVDAPGNDGNVSMPEKVKRPNPWRKMIMMMINRGILLWNFRVGNGSSMATNYVTRTITKAADPSHESSCNQQV